MQSIIFTDLSTSLLPRKKELAKAFERVVSRGIFLHGPENARLTNTLTKYFGKHIQLVASGHDAILLSLLALNLQPSDEIIVTANAYPTAFAAAQSKNQIKLADVDENGQLSIDSLKKAITPHTKVVIMVHLYGLIGDITAIKKLCKQKKLVLLEDCAQAFGTRYNQKLVGTFGDIGCFSFYPTKNLGAIGDGGAVYTKHAAYAHTITSLTQYGETQRYQSTRIAAHSRIPELQAAGLVIALCDIATLSRQKKQIYTWYVNAIQKAKLSTHIRILHSHPKSDPAQHLFVLDVDNRDALMHYLASCGIPTLIHYPTPIHLVEAFRWLKHKKGHFPMAERLSKRIISLPYHAHLSKNQVSYIIKKIRIFYETRAS